MKLAAVILNESSHTSLADWEAAAKKCGYKVTKDNKSGTYHAWDGTTHKGSFKAGSGKGSLTEATAPRKGTVAWHAMQKRKEQEKDPESIKRTEKVGDNNHQVGNAKVTHEAADVSHLHKALDRALSKEKKASPAQVQRNKERWAKRQAEKEQGVTESVHDKAVEWFKTSKPSECSKCGSKEFFRTSHAHTQKIVCSRCGTVAATKEITESRNNDMTGCECTKCHKGTYEETSQMDDMDGKLHCTNCGKEVRRWQEGVKEAFPYDVDHMPGKTIKHTNTNCTTCHGRKAMYRLDGELYADNKKGATKIKCPVCHGTGDKSSVKEADKHSFIGKIQRHHELKKKVDSTWDDAVDAEKRGDKEGASRSFKKHVRYTNLERPGTFRDVKEADQQKWKVTYDVHGSNREVPLYTNTRTVTATSADEAIATLKNLVGGRNHKAVVAETTVKEASPLSSVGFSDEFINAVYRKFHIDSTTIPDTATSKPKSSDLEKFVFLSRTPSGKAFAIGKGKNGWNGPGYGQLIVDDEGKIEYKSAPVSKVLSLVAKGQYYTIEYSNSYDRVRNQQSTTYKREDPKTGREVDPQDATYAYMQKIEKIYGARIRSEMEKVVDFVYANMRKFGQQRSSNISGTSPQERVLKIANKLEAAAKDEHLFTTRSGSWDRPSYYEQYLNSLDKLSHGYASVPTNYYTFKRVMDETPAGLAKFAKFILGTVHAYENEVKDLLANNG